MRRFFSLCLLLCLISLSPLFANWKEELKEKIEHARFPAWMLDQINEDLFPFRESGITQQDIIDTIAAFPTRGLILCQIKNNDFSWICYPENLKDDFRAQKFIIALTSLARVIPLPNVIFLVHHGETFAETSNKAPIFSWCKHREWSKKTICFPDYEALGGNENFLKDVNLGCQYFPWEGKENKAFWRGDSTGGCGFDFMPRLKLTQGSLENPKWLDAKITGIFPGQDEKLFRPYMGSRVPVVDHLRYKYQILVDGHVSAFSRAYWQLFSNCVIFKHSSPWYQWYYRELRPYEHYIPYEADASDLIEKIKWAVEHDDKAYEISQNANKFARENLKRSDILLYVYLLLNEYAKIQKFSM